MRKGWGRDGEDQKSGVGGGLNKVFEMCTEVVVKVQLCAEFVITWLVD